MVTFSALDHYIDKCRREIDQLNFKEKCNQYNLPRAELAALRNLGNRSNVVIKAADKSGAFVVWEKELYLNEAHSQLSDGRFYQRRHKKKSGNCWSIYHVHPGHSQRRTHTINNQPNCKTSANVKILFASKNTNKGNPGRPIVSACQCPTELLASYLDKVTTPFVRGLDSYVKDSGHMLTILNSFRFQGEHRFIFTTDIKSLYTVIANDEGLRALKYFLDKREVLDPPAHTHYSVWLS